MKKSAIAKCPPYEVQMQQPSALISKTPQPKPYSPSADSGDLARLNIPKLL